MNRLITPSEHLAGNGVILHAMHQMSWERIQASSANLGYIAKTISEQYQIFDEPISDYLKNPQRYAELCQRLFGIEQEKTKKFGTPWRDYWICSADDNQIAGHIGYWGGDIGIEINEPSRKKGYALAAIKLLTDHVLENKFASSIGAEVDSHHNSMIRCLYKAGFRQVTDRNADKSEGRVFVKGSFLKLPRNRKSETTQPKKPTTLSLRQPWRSVSKGHYSHYIPSKRRRMKVTSRHRPWRLTQAD